MTKTIYEYDENRYATGNTRDVGDRDPAPPGWTEVAPPNLGDGEYARFLINDWEITTVSPTDWLNRPSELARARGAKSAEAKRQYQAVLASGFTDADGTTWPVTDQARSRVLDLTQHIQEYRAGKVVNELPGGRTEVTLRDASNVLRKATANKVVELAEQGSEYKEDAQDNLESLLAQIESATSQKDLDTIDLESGWPE